MRRKGKGFLILLFFCICVILVFSFEVKAADVLLDTSAFDATDRQPAGLGWCWAASSQFVLDYYGTHVEQCAIVNLARVQQNHGSADCCLAQNQYTGSSCDFGNWLWPPDGLTPGTVIDILPNWGVTGTARSILSKSSVVYEINRRRPIMMDWYLKAYGTGHVEVLHGYRQDGAIVTVWNPWPTWTIEGGDHDWTYEAAVSGSDHDWWRSLSMVTDVPQISASPATINFGGVAVATNSTQVLTISNSGYANLAIGAIYIAGTDSLRFSKPSDSCSGKTIQPGGSCSVQIVFNPSSAGARNAALIVPSNAPNGRTLNIPLSGTGVATLAVAKTGTGTGTVTGSPGEINCGVNCTAQYWASTLVTLNAAPAPDSSFAGWLWSTCTNTGPCSLTMNTSTTLTPTFNKLQPVAGFSASVTSGTRPLIVNFIDSSSWASTWRWNFGDYVNYSDGGTSSLQNPTFTYSTPGTYTISLTVSNIAGSSTALKSAYITVAPCPNLPVRIVGKGDYSSLQSAYDASVSGDAIQVQAITFSENVVVFRFSSFPLSLPHSK